jgi:hypothetical protein
MGCASSRLLVFNHHHVCISAFVCIVNSSQDLTYVILFYFFAVTIDMAGFTLSDPANKWMLISNTTSNQHFVIRNMRSASVCLPTHPLTYSYWLSLFRTVSHPLRLLTYAQIEHPMDGWPHSGNDVPSAKHFAKVVCHAIQRRRGRHIHNPERKYTTYLLSIFSFLKN